MRTVLAGMLLVVALAVAGCGGSSSKSNGGSGNGVASKSAQQIVAAAVTAAESATYVRMNGNVNCSGKALGVNAQVANDGTGARAALVIDGKPVQLVVVATEGYLNVPAEIWPELAGANGAAIGQYLNGRWLKFPLSEPKFAELVACVGPKTLLDKVKADAASAVKVDGVTTYNGQGAVAVDNGTKDGTLYVATSGNPYPVALVKKGTGGGTIKFTAWNQPFANPTPTGAVDISQVPGY